MHSMDLNSATYTLHQMLKSSFFSKGCFWLTVNSELIIIMQVLTVFLFPFHNFVYFCSHITQRANSSYVSTVLLHLLNILKHCYLPAQPLSAGSFSLKN